MDSLPRRAKRRFGRMINSAVAVVNNSSTLRRRSHFSRSATTNSYGPIPIDGESSVPLMYSSQRSNSTTSSTNSIVSIPGFGAVSNLIQVRSLEHSTESDLNEQNKSSPGALGNDELSRMRDFIRIAEYMFITDNKDLLDCDGLANFEISHVITMGNDCPTMSSVSKKDGLLLIAPMTLFHHVDVDPNRQSFKSLAAKFDTVNLFIQNARTLSRQKIVIYSEQLSHAYFLAAQYNIDYYQLEPRKAVNHMMKVTGENWEELSPKHMESLQKWKTLGEERRSQSPPDRKLSVSVNAVQK